MCRKILILLVFSGGPIIIKGDHDVQYGGSLESGISACESCVSSGGGLEAFSSDCFIYFKCSKIIIDILLLFFSM